MNDIDTLREMLKRAGLSYDDATPNEIRVNRGYYGFFTLFTFDDEGMLRDMNAAED